MANPTAKAWPPKRVKRSAQVSMASSSVKAVDGAAGAVRHAVFDADHDGRLGGALDHARGQDADDAAMPAVAVDHQQAAGGKFGVVGKARFDGGQRRGFGVAALAVEPFELGGQFVGAARGRGCRRARSPPRPHPCGRRR